jgi:O-antigen ligase
MSSADLQALQSSVGSRGNACVHKVSRLVALSVFVWAPLPLGSTDTIWICIWTALLAISLVTADLESTTLDDFYLLLPLFFALVVVGAVVALQISPDPSFGPVNSVWQAVRENLGVATPGRISATANGPWLAFGYPLLFVLAFVRAFLIATNSDDAHRLLRILAWAGFCYALYGILAQLLDPNSLLFRHKDAYVGFATGTFVNRNTAATFWGSCAILFLLPLLRLIYRSDRPSSPPSQEVAALIGYHLSSSRALATGFGVCVLAVAMTGSRAGLLLSLATFLLASALFLTPLRIDNFRRWGLLLGSVVAALVLLQLIGGIVAGRILVYGLIDEQRLTVYRTTYGIIREHPLLGIGYGNFEAVFPAYRPAELGSLGLWDRAHSTPLELAVELGLPAAALIFAVSLWCLYQMLRGSLRRRRDRYIPIIGASVAILGFLHSSIDFSLQIPGFGVFFAAITGCGLAQCRPSSVQKKVAD